MRLISSRYPLLTHTTIPLPLGPQMQRVCFHLRLEVSFHPHPSPALLLTSSPFLPFAPAPTGAARPGGSRFGFPSPQPTPIFPFSWTPAGAARQAVMTHCSSLPNPHSSSTLRVLPWSTPSRRPLPSPVSTTTTTSVPTTPTSPFSPQVQHVKVDGEAAMLRLDQILRANELSLSLMAALPALGACWAALVAAVRCGTGCTVYMG